MSLIHPVHQVILYLFVRTTLCQNYTVTVSFNETKHITAMYGECFKIPYEYTPPWKNVPFLYTEVWFYGNKEMRNGPLFFPRDNITLTLESLPPGEYVFGLRLEWGHNKTYTYPETVQVSVSASTKSPQVTMENLIQGRPTTLRCTAPQLCNRESPQITWSGPKMTPIPRRNMMRFSPLTSTVQITPRAEDHNTNVTCRLHYKYNVLTEKTVILKVQYPPKILSSSQCVYKENKIVCKCIAQGNPLPTIHWLIPSVFSLTNYTITDSQAVEATMHIQESYNFTIRCVSSNNLGSDTKNLTAQRSISKPTCERKNAASVPWSITGVSLCLCLVMLIIVIFQYKQAQKRKSNEEVNMYDNLRTTDVEEYSNISPHHNFG